VLAYSRATPPATLRAAEVDPRRASAESDRASRSRPAAADAAVASAANADAEAPSPTFAGNEFSETTRAPAAIPARRRTASRTVVAPSWPVASMGPPSTAQTSRSVPNSTVVRVADGAVQTETES